jgi:hypothetical protein
MLIIHTISRNITEIKKNIIDIELTNIKNLLTYLIDKNIIYSYDYSVYYNNIKIDNFDCINKTGNISLIVSDNNIKLCSCCKK